MKQMGSLVNHLAANSRHVFTMPEVGEGVTFYSWSDRSAGTVVELTDPKKLIIAVTDDEATRTDKNGMSDCQSYEYKTNWDGRKRYYRWSAKKNQWQGVEQNEKGRWVLNHNQTISLGNRDAHHDYSF